MDKMADLLESCKSADQQTSADSEESQRKFASNSRTSGTCCSSCLTPGLEALVFNWHVALLEGCAGAPLSQLSLFEWDQEDSFEYRGAHWYHDHPPNHPSSTAHDEAFAV